MMGFLCAGSFVLAFVVIMCNKSFKSILTRLAVAMGSAAMAAIIADWVIRYQGLLGLLLVLIWFAIAGYELYSELTDAPSFKEVVIKVKNSILDRRARH